MSMSPSSYMTSPETSYSQAMPSWNALASQPDPMSAYGYNSGTATPQMFYNFPTVSDGTPALFNHSASYAVQPYSDYYSPSTTMPLTSQFANLTVDSTSSTGGVSISSSISSSSNNNRMVYTEQRGIHIRDLSRRATEDQVRKLIREAAGREADLINGVEVPLDKKRTPRGWAFVHFHSADLARRMVVVLNGFEFKGRKLQVRLLKEGETVGASGDGGGGDGAAVATAVAGPSSKGHRGAKHGDRRDDGRRKEKEREKERGERSTASRSSPPSNKSGPLVVGGGAAHGVSSSGSSKGKGKEKEKVSNTKFSVVIADGSSLGRW